MVAACSGSSPQCSSVNTIRSLSVSLTRWRSDPSQPRILVSNRNGLACSTMVHRAQTKSPFSLCQEEAILQKCYSVHSYLLISAVDELGCAKSGGHHEEEEGRVQENVLGEN